MLRLVFATFLAGLCALPLRAAIIARDGEAAMVIALPGDPMPSERFAAEELA